MSKKWLVVLGLALGLFCLGFLGVFGYYRLNQYLPNRSDSASKAAVELAARDISFRVESKIPGITAELKSTGLAWIKDKMAEINYPDDKSFVVIQNGQLTPVYPDSVVFVFEPIDPLDRATRENSLYEKTTSVGEVVAGMQSELRGKEAVYTIYLDTTLLGKTSDEKSASFAYRMLRALFAGNKQAPAREQLDGIWKILLEKKEWPIQVGLQGTSYKCYCLKIKLC